MTGIARLASSTSFTAIALKMFMPHPSRWGRLYRICCKLRAFTPGESPMTTKTALLDEARGLLDETVDLRRRIHRHPEIGLTLPRTQQTVLEALDGLGLKTHTGQKTTS